MKRKMEITVSSFISLEYNSDIGYDVRLRPLRQN